MKKYSNYNIEKGTKIIAICKLDGFESNDVDNKGGFLTRHLKNYFNIEIPNLYFRKKYAKEHNGNNWLSQFYYFKELEIEKTKKCPLCDWETTDIENKSGTFETHLRKVHNLSKKEYLELYQEDKGYFENITFKKDLNNEEDKAKYVTCAICGKRLRRIDWKHLSLHNITLEEYIKTYGDETVSDKTRKILSENAIKSNTNMSYSFISKEEKEIINFIDSLGIKNRKDKKLLNGKEIDILMEDINFAIEYNGLIWHSEEFGNKDNFFHLNKTTDCEENNIQLIHIFEDEFIFKKEILYYEIERRLNNRNISIDSNINLNIIKSDDNELIKNFIYKNSLFPYVDSLINYICLDKENNLIGVISLNYDDNNNLIVTNFAVEINSYNEDIIFKKFIDYIKNDLNFNDLIAYADRRYFSLLNENFYTKANFIFDSYIEPTFNILVRGGHFRNRRISLDEFNQFYPKDYKKYKVWNCGYIKYIFNKN